MIHRGMMPVPPKKQVEGFRECVDLPVIDPHCEKVDLTDRMCSPNCFITNRAASDLSNEIK